jgi:hypothetical protein
MSIKDMEVPFGFNQGHRTDTFVAIRELGFNSMGAFVVNGYSTPPPEPRGTFFTSIPISKKEYREKHPTQAGFHLTRLRIIFYDDWGERYSIYAAPAILKQLAYECVINGIPETAGG